MKFTVYQESRIGRRQSNQDRLAYCYSRDALMLVVADGMGGHLHGEVAAQIAVEYITQAFQRAAKTQVPDATVFLSRALTNAHHAILDYAFDKFLPEAPRTTIVACVIQDNTAWWAHAGDSRLYLIREGRIAAQTKDHSRVQMMIDQGLLDAEGAARHPERNRIYSCLGGNHPPQIDFSKPVRLHDDDVLLLCSDGVWGPLTGADLEQAVAAANVMEATPRILDAAERRAGASCDNLSLLALQWHDELASGSTAVSTQTMGLESFTTQLDAFGDTRSPRSGAEFSDNEIEKAIAEINTAIQKFSK
jgi:serine/threonine protein phosphatase PrpC